MDQALVDLGREVVRDGRLVQLRLALSLSRNAMAIMIGTTAPTYRSWELVSDPDSDIHDVKMWPQTAERVGRFFLYAQAQLVLLKEHDIKIEELAPLFVASSHIGAPQELLLKRYRENCFHAEDLGMLGLWVYRSEFNEIAECL